MDIESAVGKVFHAGNNKDYGIIRPLSGDLPSELKNAADLTPIAEDECGNYFVCLGNAVLFWDHETSETVELAGDLSEFFANCDEATEVELKEEQVKSAWIDPEFAKELGIEKP